MLHRVQPAVAVVLTVSLVVSTVGSALAQSRDGDPDAQPTLSGRIEAAIASHAADLAGDPAAVREFVAAHVRPEPYDGVFKGANGAYLTGGANGADQALLIEALLPRADDAPATRFASCDLDDSAGAALRDAWLAVEPLTLDLARIEEAASDIDYQPFRDALREVRQTYEQLQAEAAARADTLAADLAAAGWRPGDATAGAVRSPTTHVWLQIEQDGTWVDLDPTTADGAARCTPSSTFDSMPPEASHVLTIRVIAERLADGGLSESTLLEASWPTADIATSRMAFVFGEATGLIDAERPTSARWPYTPLLRIDNEDLTGSAIELPPILGTTGGLLSDATEALGGLGGLGGGQDPSDDAGGGLLGGLGGDETSAEEMDDFTQADPVTAIWLEFEHAAASGQAFIGRSEFFDRIGPAARAGDASALEVPDAVVFDGEYLDLQQIWQVGALLGPIAAIEGSIDLEGVLLTTFDGLSSQIDGVLRSFPAMLPPRSVAPGVPIIMLLGLRLQPGEDEGPAAFATILDAVHVPGTPPADVAEAARDAVSIPAAEEMLLRAMGAIPDELATVVGVFDAAVAAGIPPVSVRSVDDLAAVTASEDALTRVRQRLDEGYSVLLPASAPSVGNSTASGWYLIDPATGIVRDQHESGRHAAAEDAPLRQRVAQFAGRTYETACRVARPFVFATSVMIVVVVPAGGDNALRASMAARAEQQRLLDETVSVACSTQGTPGAGA